MHACRLLIVLTGIVLVGPAGCTKAKPAKQPAGCEALVDKRIECLDDARKAIGKHRKHWIFICEQAREEDKGGKFFREQIECARKSSCADFRRCLDEISQPRSSTAK